MAIATKLGIKSSGSGWNDGIRLETSSTTDAFQIVNDGTFRIGYNSSDLVDIDSSGNLTVAGTIHGDHTLLIDGDVNPQLKMSDGTYGADLEIESSGFRLTFNSFVPFTSDINGAVGLSVAGQATTVAGNLAVSGTTTMNGDLALGSNTLTTTDTTVVSNLNSDQVDGKDSTDLVLVDGTQPLTADWDTGNWIIRAKVFYSDIATGTSPLTITSTTKVPNLNADQVDGIHGTEGSVINPYRVRGTTNSATTARLPSGWSYSSSGTGYQTLNHPFGDVNFTAVVSPENSTGIIAIVTKTSTQITIYTFVASTGVAFSGINYNLVCYDD